jgi:hypothetical protein
MGISCFRLASGTKVPRAFALYGAQSASRAPLLLGRSAERSRIIERKGPAGSLLIFFGVFFEDSEPPRAGFGQDIWCCVSAGAVLHEPETFVGRQLVDGELGPQFGVAPEEYPPLRGGGSAARKPSVSVHSGFFSRAASRPPISKLDPASCSTLYLAQGGGESEALVEGKVRAG